MPQKPLFKTSYGRSYQVVRWVQQFHLNVVTTKGEVFLNIDNISIVTMPDLQKHKYSMRDDTMIVNAKFVKFVCHVVIKYVLK
jgi:hypothetical protein